MQCTPCHSNPHSSPTFFNKKIPLLSLRRIPFFTKDDGKSNPVHEKTLLFGAGGASCATLRGGLCIVLALATVVGFSSINFNAAAGGKKAYTLHMMPAKGLHTARGAACLDGSDAGFYFRKASSGHTNDFMIYFEGKSSFLPPICICVWFTSMAYGHDCLQRHFPLCTTCSPFARIYAPFYHGLFQYTFYILVHLFRVANKPDCSAMFWGRTVHLLGGGWCFNDFGGSAF